MQDADLIVVNQTWQKIISREKNQFMDYLVQYMVNIILAMACHEYSWSSLLRIIHGQKSRLSCSNWTSPFPGYA